MSKFPIRCPRAGDARKTDETITIMIVI